MKYMLDTNQCIFLMRNTPQVVEKYGKHTKDGITISTITLAEMEVSLYLGVKQQQNLATLAAFLTGLTVLDFDAAAANEYGKIRADLQKRGCLIGNMNMLIAAHAKSRRLTLVSNNTREFSWIQGLCLDDWL
jgi:tRNA(fMet)-specific endonuclease VapC